MSELPENPTPRGESRFAAIYERPPVWSSLAPGRVNLIGEHIDYNDGFVLPAAIERYVTIFAAPNHSDQIRIRSHVFEEEAAFSLGSLPAVDALSASWMRYPLGVLAEYVKGGASVPGMDLWVESTLPFGGGLSSSAAFEVALANVLEIASGHLLEPREKALLCQRAEHAYAGVPCGIMDQFAVIMSRKEHLLLLDCQSQEIRDVPFDDGSVSLLIADTKVKHALATSAYAERRAACDQALRALNVKSWRDVREEDLDSASALLDDVLFRRARHVVTEIKRTQDAVEAMRESAWEELGQLMFSSHQSLAQDYEVSCPELDLMVELGLALGPGGGVFGIRMTGGGFGGSTVSLVRTELAAEVLAYYKKHYQDQTGTEPDAFITRPVEGAQAWRLPVS